MHVGLTYTEKDVRSQRGYPEYWVGIANILKWSIINVHLNLSWICILFISGKVILSNKYKSMLQLKFW